MEINMMAGAAVTVNPDGTHTLSQAPSYSRQIDPARFKVATVRVWSEHFPDGTLINSEDYDPITHILFDDYKPPQPAKARAK